MIPQIFGRRILSYRKNTVLILSTLLGSTLIKTIYLILQECRLLLQKYKGKQNYRAGCCNTNSGLLSCQFVVGSCGLCTNTTICEIHRGGIVLLCLSRVYFHVSKITMINLIHTIAYMCLEVCMSIIHGFFKV